MSQRILVLLLSGFLSAALVACGGGSSTPGPKPDPRPDPGNAMRARLVACPVVDQSSDAAASACLAGTYVGKTLTDAECKLVIEASGSYQFTSPSLSYIYTATANSIRVFGHQNAGGLHQVIWLINDPVQRGDAFNLSFRYADGLGKKLEMEGTRRTEAGGSVSATCTATLSY